MQRFGTPQADIMLRHELLSVCGKKSNRCTRFFFMTPKAENQRRVSFDVSLLQLLFYALDELVHNDRLRDEIIRASLEAAYDVGI